MRIQHNIAAINSHRNLGGNNDAVSKNLEKLSSGYRINKAGDDAAGLAISEKMRAQIKGLETAQKNAQDGISLVQTAEGNLTEVHSMLNRMVELATQSANGTYDDTVDRNNLQKEVESLKKEINRISESANYNGIKLLDGSLGAGKAADALGAKEVNIGGDAANIKWNDAVKQTKVYDVKWANSSAEYTISYKNDQGETKSFTLKAGDAIGTPASAAETMAKALSGERGGMSYDASEAENVLEFSRLFKAEVSGNKLVIQAKSAGTEGASFGDIATNNAAAGSATFDATATSTNREAADASMAFDVSSNSNSTYQIGGKTYNVSNAANSAATAQELIRLLRDDGITATLAKDPTDLTGATNLPGTIQITSLDKIAVTQEGAGISSSNSQVQLNSADATKNSFDVTLGAAGTSGTYNVTVNYVDENGKEQSKNIEYKTTVDNNVDNAGAVLEAALKADSDLKKIFDVSYDVATDKLNITAKTPGSSGAKITGMETSDVTAHAFENPVTTEGTNAGTKLSLSKDTSLANNGNFAAGDTVTINGKTFEFVQRGNDVKGSGNIAVFLGSDGDESLETLKNVLNDNGIKASFKASTEAVPGTKDGNAYIIIDNDQGQAAKGGLVLQVGESNEEYQRVTVQVGSMDTKSLDIDDVNIGEQGNAWEAIDKIKAAINTVSSTRGDLGAIQNRLEHTINNLGVTTENMTAAESRIRDVDMAKEMMDFTKNNILTQAAQAMLAQANQLPQGVLQLLR